MLWFILVIPCAFFIFKDCFTGWMSPESFVDGMGSLFCAVFLTVLCAGVALGCDALTGIAFKSHAVEIERSNLVAIRDKNGITGSFFLGSGMINSDQYYFYYEQKPDGGFKPGKIMVGQGVRVYEEDRKDAQLVTFTWKLDSKWSWLIALPVNEGGYAYDFHVPKGTIRVGYTM